MPLTPGTRLGPYEIVAPLGAGGMGEVYRARDERLGRDVALKMLPAAFQGDRERLARFEREARTVAGLNHPNIVVLHSIEEAGGCRFLTMELVEGRSLDRLVTPGGLPVARVLEIGLSLADALIAAHERGVVHRDLKPANVMLTRDDRIKVLDFGLAKLADPGPMVDATRAMTLDVPVSSAGQVVGTIPYMAPEQVRGEAADTRTDLFALGAILYELATGRRPFPGDTPADVTSGILRDTPPSLTGLRAELPGDLERIVSRCLEKEPRSRYQTALDVHNELRRLKRTLESAGAPTALPAATDVPSIAVLPFVNMSRDEENEYFSDGLAEELLNVLAKIRGLRVAARSSAFTFKGKGATVAEVGKTLSVATVLEGSVRKAGNRVRIGVQLVKVSDGFHLWSETYDRTLDDIFAVQDDIARSVVKELRTTLLGEEPDSNASGEARAEVAAAAKGRGGSGEAHRLYLQGRFLINRFTGPDIANGIEHLRRAIDVEPGHALAWASLSWAHAIAAAQGFAPAVEGNARAREAALNALALEPDLAEGHHALGVVQHFHDWDWKAADASYRRALELAPGNAEALDTAALLAYNLGRIDEALALIRRAVEQDPLAFLRHMDLGRICRVAGLLADAERAYRKALELSPEGIVARAWLAFILDAQGRGDEALALALEERADWARLFALAVLHHTAGRRADSDRALRKLEETRSSDAAMQIAVAHAVRGEIDAAFEWLEKGYTQRDSGLAALISEPFLRPLHADPRWGALLTKMGLAD